MAAGIGLAVMPRWLGFSEEQAMPKTEKGKKIYQAMVDEYGPEKGKQVFYASANKGTIKGVHKKKRKKKRS